MNKIMAILGNGYTTLCAAILAVIVGFGFPHIGKMFTTFSNMFITLISISVIPIIFASVTSSVIKLMSGESKDIKISRVIFWFISALVVASMIGMMCCEFFNPSDSVASSRFISDMIFEDMQKSILVISTDQPLSSFQSFSFADFLTTLLPKNPFEAFAKGNVIQILAISIFVGIAIATLSADKKDATLHALAVVLSSFKAILKVPTKILPIGIFCLLASNLTNISIDVLSSMRVFCLSAVVSFLLIIALGFLIMWIYSPVGLITSIKHLKESMTVAFSTCSNQATLPFLTATLSRDFRLKEEAVDLAIPLGVTMCRTSNAAYYAFVVIFIASLYNEPLSAVQSVFIIFGSILASLAASGASGVIAITLISIILDPLNLSVGSILTVLIIVEPILEPIRTVASLVMNAAISCAVINGKKKAQEAIAQEESTPGIPNENANNESKGD